MKNIMKKGLVLAVISMFLLPAMVMAKTCVTEVETYGFRDKATIETINKLVSGSVSEDLASNLIRGAIDAHDVLVLPPGTTVGDTKYDTYYSGPKGTTPLVLVDIPGKGKWWVFENQVTCR